MANGSIIMAIIEGTSFTTAGGVRAADLENTELVCFDPNSSCSTDAIRLQTIYLVHSRHSFDSASILLFFNSNKSTFNRGFGVLGRVFKQNTSLKKRGVLFDILI